MSSPSGPDRRSQAAGVGGAEAARQARGVLTVCFTDFDTARRAIEELETSGVEATSMAFEDESLERASDSSDSGRRDTRFVSRALTKFRRGALVGVVVGAVAGAAIGAFAVGDGPLAGLGVLVLISAVVGGLVGGAVSGIWNHPQSAAWEEALEAPEAGKACLRITVADEDQAVALADVLGQYGGWLEQDDEQQSAD